jgi:hypothetical protein
VAWTLPLTTRPDGTAPAVNIRTPGVYPVVVELLDADDDVVDTLRTHLVRLPAIDPDDETEPLGVAVVVPFGAPPAYLDPDLDAVPAADLPVADLTEVLAAHPDVPINLAVVPESVAAVASTEPTVVDELAAALGSSQVLAAPWVRLDEAAWTRADGDELERQLAIGAETLRRLLGADLEPVRLAPAGGGPDQLAALVEHGARALVVADDDLDALDDDDFPYTLGRPFRVALGDDESVPALASDAGLEARAATAEDDPVLAAHLILADLAVIAQDEPESARAATVVLPDEAVHPMFLDALLGGLEPPAPPVVAPPTDPTATTTVPLAIPAARPAVAGTTLTDAFRAVEPAGADGGADAEDPLLRRPTADDTVTSVGRVAEALAARRADLGSYRGIFGPGDDLAVSVDHVLTTAAAADLEPGARAAALAAVDGAIGAELAALQGPQAQQVTLTARSGRVQLRLTNDTGRAADVVLRVRGDRLVLPDAVDDQIPVHLTGPTFRLDLRVETRSSGDTALDIQLLSPDGRLELGPPSRITVRATAVSGVGIFLMGAAAAFLAAWWTRTILRDRRAGRNQPAHART